MFVQLYVVPCIVPALLGTLLLRSSAAPQQRLLARMTLKPLLGTLLLLAALWLLQGYRGAVEPIVIVPVLHRPALLTPLTLLALPLIGLGLTAALLWRFRAALPTMPPALLAALLLLDTLRWGSTWLTYVLGTNGFDRLALTALGMPTVFALCAWALWSVIRRGAAPPT